MSKIEKHHIHPIDKSGYKYVKKADNNIFFDKKTTDNILDNDNQYISALLERQIDIMKKNKSV